jgi:plastocyanin
LRLAAAADLVVLLVTVVVLRDLLALALVALLLMGLGLLRFRGGWMGAILLALVFADVSFYTLSGAISNILYGGGIAALVLPAALATISLAGLISAIAVVVQRRNAAAGSRATRIVGQGAVAFFVILLVAGLITGGAGKQAEGHADIALETVNMGFSRTGLTAEQGEVTVTLANHDLFWHTFTIDALGVNLAVPVGGERGVTFTAPPGTYEFYCAVPTHASLGMRGTLTVR